MKKRFFLVMLLISLLLVSSPVYANEDSSSTEKRELRGIAYGNGIYVAVGQKGLIKTSEDGVTWTVERSGVSEDLEDVVWGNNEFVTVGYEKVLKSSDGKHWENVKIEDGRGTFNAVIWTGKSYMAVGYESIYISRDGSTWRKGDHGEASYLCGLTYNGRQYIAVGGYWGSGRVMLSNDGVKWNGWTEEISDSALRDVVWTGKKFVAVGGDAGDGKIFSSTDGRNWELVYTYPLKGIYGIAWDGKNYVAVGMGGIVLISQDGVKWDKYDSGSYIFSKNVLLNDGKCIIAGGETPLVFSMNKFKPQVKLKACLKKEKVYLEWNKVSGAVGYNIYHANKSGSYSNIPVTDFPVDGNFYYHTKFNKGLNFYIVKPIFKDGTEGMASNEAKINTSSCRTIILQVGNPNLKIDGVCDKIDSKGNVFPILKEDRVMVPIRRIVEAMNGTLQWDDREKKTTILVDNTKIEMWLNKKLIRVNGQEQSIDVAPTVIQGRTMLPLRFVVDNLHCHVQWEGKTKQVIITIK